jgi:hypothetical protein
LAIEFVVLMEICLVWRNVVKNRNLLLSAVAVVLCGPLYATCKIVHAQEFGCAESARLLRYSCGFDARDDWLTSLATCADSSAGMTACSDEARLRFDEAGDECSEVYAARGELCELLDDAVHEPAFGSEFASEFVDPTQIGAGVAPNPYFPLVAGNVWVYEGPEETITVTVTDKTKLIDGIDCLVVNDLVVDEDGLAVEDTDDWFAQDLDGNVWYCGEIAENYELFEDDEPPLVELVDIDGSWKHGRDFARAGMLLPAAPSVGDVIRQEVLYTDAEDVIEVLSVTASETAPAGACVETCLQTRDFTPLEPDAEEHKFYAAGIGMIVEINLEDDERVELVQFIGVGS